MCKSRSESRTGEIGTPKMVKAKGGLKRVPPVAFPRQIQPEMRKIAEWLPSAPPCSPEAPDGSHSIGNTYSSFLVGFVARERGLIRYRCNPCDFLLSHRPPQVATPHDEPE